MSGWWGLYKISDFAAFEKEDERLWVAYFREWKPVQVPGDDPRSRAAHVMRTLMQEDESVRKAARWRRHHPTDEWRDRRLPARDRLVCIGLLVYRDGHLMVV